MGNKHEHGASTRKSSKINSVSEIEFKKTFYFYASLTAYRWRKMLCFAFMLIGLTGFGTCAEDGFIRLSTRAEPATIFDLDELAKIMGEKLDIATIKGDIKALRGDLTHCVTGWSTWFGLPDGPKKPRTVSFGKAFSKKPQVMVAVMGAGKSRTHQGCSAGEAVEFDIHEKAEVTKSSFTVQVMTKAGKSFCHTKSYVYFSYIACGTYG